MRRERGPKAISILFSIVIALSCLGGPMAAVASEDTESETIEDQQSPEELTPTVEAIEGEDGQPPSDEPDPAVEAIGEEDDISSEGSAPSEEGSPILLSAEDVNAEPQQTRAEHPNVITSIVAETLDGSTTVGWNSAFRLDATFLLPDGQVHEGDTTIIQLPDELMFFSTVGFPITNPDGEVVANAVVDGSTKTLTLTYTDYPEKHSGVDGDFHFYVRVDHAVVTEEQDIELVFTVGGSVVHGGTIHSGAPTQPSKPLLTKSGWQNESDGANVFRHSIAINREGIAVPNAVVTDEILTSDTYIQSTLRVYRGNWVLNGTSWTFANRTDVTAQCPVTWSSDNHSFAVELGDIAADEGYEITYSTECSYTPADGEVFYNRVTITGNGTVLSTTVSSATHFGGGGSAGGYVCGIILHKVDAETGDALAGAVFDVIRESTGTSVGTITTEADGTGSINGLLKDSYLLVEISSPVGYKLLDTPIRISADEFDAEKIVEVTAENEPLTTSLTVTKQWVGPVTGPVTVNLFADGTAYSTITLDEASGWSATIEGLPLYDTVDGHEIIYSISEDPVPGYTTTITGDMESGFVITNAHEPKVTPPAETTPPTTPPAQRSSLPKTSDQGLLLVVASVVAVSGFFLICIASRRRDDESL